ncbi:MAG: hypothetical protein Q9201_003251 [Fulgogasparrea decipioides]
MSVDKTCLRWHVDHPKASLTCLFCIWKLLLLTVAYTSPAPGYDTSTTILTSTTDQYADSKSCITEILQVLVIKLTRWDAIYFTQVAQRGALFEQEWAFGWGFARFLSLVGPIRFGLHDGALATAVAGIFTSNTAHLLSVLVLYQMTMLIAAHAASYRSMSVAFIAASLHILSPAGLFLSAPYAESCFSFLNLSGFYLYALSLKEDCNKRHSRRDISLLLSGLLFGVATTFRSNGLLSGLLFCLDLLRAAVRMTTHIQSGNLMSDLRRSTFLVMSGGVMALGSFTPQYLAYQEYCLAPELHHRPLWCTRRIPSIYTWVQDRYWNVGFLRYWTASNAPLFLLAAPVLLIMIMSVVWTQPSYCEDLHSDREVGNRPQPPSDRLWMSPVGVDVTRCLAIPQLILAILALTIYHVQIITRLSSGYPLWYWWLASKIVDKESIRYAGFDISVKTVVRWMVLYAFIQASLFAAFLPPA